jgi:hypothetical protein
MGSRRHARTCREAKRGGCCGLAVEYGPEKGWGSSSLGDEVRDLPIQYNIIVSHGFSLYDIYIFLQGGFLTVLDFIYPPARALDAKKSLAARKQSDRCIVILRCAVGGDGSGGGAVDHHVTSAIAGRD